LQQTYALSANEGVTFRQLSAEAATYRDAVEFGNGVKVRLQDLEEGQTVAILALSSEEIRFQQENMISVDAPFGTQA
jgi:hypothetical protein